MKTFRIILLLCPLWLSGLQAARRPTLTSSDAPSGTIYLKPGETFRCPDGRVVKSASKRDSGFFSFVGFVVQTVLCAISMVCFLSLGVFLGIYLTIDYYQNLPAFTIDGSPSKVNLSLFLWWEKKFPYSFFGEKDRIKNFHKWVNDLMKEAKKRDEPRRQSSQNSEP